MVGFSAQRRQGLVALGALGFLCLCPEVSAAPSPSTLLVLGDSLSAAFGLREEEGWVALLAERLKGCAPFWQVVNASLSGETTSGGRQRLPALLARHHPRVVVLALGANDGLRGLPIAAMHANLVAMVRAARAAEAQVVLVGMQIPPNLGPDYSAAFVTTFARVADEEKVAGFVPFLLAPIALDPKAFQADGLHPTAAVQPLLLDTVWPAVAPLVGCG